MADTVICATSKMSKQRNLSMLIEATHQTNRSMHPTKSKLFAVNTEDWEPCRLGDIEISYQDVYIYLGSLGSNSNMTKQVASHAATK